MLRTARAAGLTAGLLAVLTLAACGDAADTPAGNAGSAATVTDTSFAGQSAEQVLEQARTALEGVDAVRVSGTTDALSIPIVSGPASMDITIVNGTGVTGEVKVGSGSLKVLMVGDHTYSQPDAALLADLGPMGASISTLLGGKWMEADAAELTTMTSGSDGGVDPLGMTSTWSALEQGIAAGSTLTRVPGKVIDGQQTTGVRFTVAGADVSEAGTGAGAGADASSAGTGTVYVATDGTPYPLRIERPGTTISLSNWDKKVAIRTPDASEIVDMGQLGLGSALGDTTP